MLVPPEMMIMSHQEVAWVRPVRTEEDVAGEQAFESPVLVPPQPGVWISTGALEILAALN